MRHSMQQSKWCRERQPRSRRFFLLSPPSRAHTRKGACLNARGGSGVKEGKKGGKYIFFPYFYGFLFSPFFLQNSPSFTLKRLDPSPVRRSFPPLFHPISPWN